MSQKGVVVMGSIMMRKEEVSAVKAMALTIAKGYCEDNNLSYDKLLKQEFALIYDTAFFAQPSGIKPDGLKNNLETQAKPTFLMLPNSVTLKSGLFNFSH